MINEELANVTRFEIIHHTDCDACFGSGRIRIEGQETTLECPACHGGGFRGREFVFDDQGRRIEASIQDDGRTLKIFIKERV